MLSFFPLAVLDEIWDVIESVSEGFLAYSFILFLCIDKRNFQHNSDFIVFHVSYISKSLINVPNISYRTFR